MCIFRSCVGVLNKNTNTKDARMQDSKSIYYLPRALVQRNFKHKRFCCLRLPLVVARRRELHYKILFLSPLLELKSGTEREVSERTSEFTFLVTSLLNDKEVTSKSAQISARHGVRISTGRILHTKFFGSG